MSELTEQLSEIARAIRGGDAVLFVGAGLSMGAGAPSWDQLVGTLRAKLRPPTDEPAGPLVAQFFLNQYGRHRLFEEIRALLNRQDLAPTAAHRAMCSLPVKVIATTNFDELIEVTLRELQRRAHV